MIALVKVLDDLKAVPKANSENFLEMVMFRVPLLKAILRGGLPSFYHLLGALVVVGLGIGLIAPSQPGAYLPQTQEQIIPAADFSRMIREFSEEEGYFLSDNLVSNETSYLHVLGKLEELAATGEGAYLGVGPEQNFTYIAKIRPKIAFIVDIRHQAMIQQLMYKAIFHLSENRAQFLSLLFSKSLGEENPPGSDTSLPDLVSYFERTPGREETFRGNIDIIEKTIQTDFQFPLSPDDQSALEYVYAVFWEENLDIRFLFRGRWSWGRFPTLRGMILEKDLQGQLGNFLAQEKDYQFVRELHLRNRIIPVVGDFSGNKALAAVGDYLERNGYSVSVFYTSNVEQYLFRSGIFGAFAENVRKLPIDEKSLFIRAFTGMGGLHPARVPGHRLSTILQKMTVFLEDYDQNLYPDYWDLLTTNFISANQP